MDNFDDNDFECSEYSEVSRNNDNDDKDHAANLGHEVCDDSNHLYTPHGSDDEEEYEKFTTYKSGERVKFQLGIIFIRNDVIRDTIKDYKM